MINKLILGDNLKVMKSLESESIDLIITDPPFNSGVDYEEFDDRWSSLENYLNFMKERLVECHRLLKDTGTLYLHCDTSASHYLKVELDKIFGIENFRNEIVWTYHKLLNAAKIFPRCHDIILSYRKTNKVIFNIPYEENPTEGMLVKRKKGYFIDSRKSGKKLFIYNPNTPDSQKHLNSGEFSEDEIVYVTEENANKGKRIVDVWTDIPILKTLSKEWKYPTQKPIKLYQRIIKASSNAGQVVLDPFCGGGTTADAAQSLGRRWIAIDLNENAIQITADRIQENYGMTVDFEVVKHE